MSHTHLAALAALVAGAPGASSAAAPAPSPAAGQAAADRARVVQVRASRIHLGDGNRLEDGVLVVRDGKIERVGRGVEVDPRHPVIEHDGVLTAGMVACGGDLATRGQAHDETRSILGAARVCHALDAGHPALADALAAGITALVVTPSPANVVGGTTCVVKTDDGSVVASDAHLAMSFDKEALTQGRQTMFFFFSGREVDDLLEESGSEADGTRAPTSYPGLVAALEAAVGEPSGVFERVAAGELPVLIVANERHEVARAVAFARRHGLRGAVKGAPLAGEVAELLAGSGLAVVVGPFELGHAMRSLAGLSELVEAGVPFAFAVGGDEDAPEEMRLSAAMAVAAGLDPVAAWKALTADAARIAAVDGRLGRLERGLDADFVLWSGDPLDLTSRVEAVFVDGELVHGGVR